MRSIDYKDYKLYKLYKEYKGYKNYKKDVKGIKIVRTVKIVEIVRRVWPPAGNTYFIFLRDRFRYHSLTNLFKNSSNGSKCSSERFTALAS